MIMWKLRSDTVRVKKVIITTTLRRGKGIEGDPIRIVTEVFTLEGYKIAENDPIEVQNHLK
jgi:hypothetical protein